MASWCKFHKNNFELICDFIYKFSMIWYMYIDKEQEQITTGDRVLMSNETFCNYDQIVQI